MHASTTPGQIQRAALRRAAHAQAMPKCLLGRISGALQRVACVESSGHERHGAGQADACGSVPESWATDASVPRLTPHCGLTGLRSRPKPAWGRSGMPIVHGGMLVCRGELRAGRERGIASKTSVTTLRARHKNGHRQTQCAQIPASDQKDSEGGHHANMSTQGT